ncbi:hypothetical protein H4R20_002843 [Coemansia guatemalensis]|uniref:Mis18 domain-containing protein n=1 Tax=Coemansia guatemalensis TaxID=2761395 RepID=A0A9W8HWF9_9FUNG|nr:hypothetical protein H4R20_002843 [Coemansia guatemalensis]
MDRLRGDIHDTGYRPGDTSGGGFPDSSGSANGSGDEVINGPVVFSCAKCRTIIGDTFAYVASIPERNLFALSEVPDSVMCGKSRKISSEHGEDGCVYYDLTCAECDSLIGRRYVTTIEDMDVIRNAYALDIQRVMTYELGKCMGGRPPNSDRPPPPEFYTSVAFQEDLNLVKNNVTAIAAKLQKLEQTMARMPTTSPRSATSSTRKRSMQGLNPEIYQIDPSKKFGR